MTAPSANPPCLTCQRWTGHQRTTPKGFAWCAKLRRHVRADDGCRAHQPCRSLTRHYTQTTVNPGALCHDL